MIASAEMIAFADWFMGSKVVDTGNAPLIVYHGTSIPKVGFRREGGASGVGAYFTEDKLLAKEYAIEDASVDGEKPILIEAFLSIKNPIVFTSGMRSQHITVEQRDSWEASGYDGVKTEYRGGVEWVAFRPEQVRIILSTSFREV